MPAISVSNRDFKAHKHYLDTVESKPEIIERDEAHAFLDHSFNSIT